MKHSTRNNKNMTKLQALSKAIEYVDEQEVKDAMDEDEEKQILERLNALRDLEDDIIRFLNKKLTAVELYKRLRQ